MMMIKSFATVLLMGLTLSASAGGPVRGVETQQLQFEVGVAPDLPGHFYCDVKPTVSYAVIISSDANFIVTGFNGGNSTVWDSNTSELLNQVYFTANIRSFTGSGPGIIDVVYIGNIGDMACYDGQGNRTIEFTGQ